MNRNHDVAELTLNILIIFEGQAETMFVSLKPTTYWHFKGPFTHFSVVFSEISHIQVPETDGAVKVCHLREVPTSCKSGNLNLPLLSLLRCLGRIQYIDIILLLILSRYNYVVYINATYRLQNILHMMCWKENTHFCIFWHSICLVRRWWNRLQNWRVWWPWANSRWIRTEVHGQDDRMTRCQEGEAERKDMWTPGVYCHSDVKRIQSWWCVALYALGST